MSIQPACPRRQRLYDLPDAAAGRAAKCECGDLLTVPEASTVAATTA